MATCLTPMLRCATRILFIDPHFSASQDRGFLNPLCEFLRIICDGSRQVNLEYHTGDAQEWNHFRRECKRHLPSIIPKGFTLTVRRWKERAGGERLHNRYILTDIGGVAFSHGLDEGPAGTDDIFLLDKGPYLLRFKQYSDPIHAFDSAG